jgi:hypothetical protein
LRGKNDSCHCIVVWFAGYDHLRHPWAGTVSFVDLVPILSLGPRPRSPASILLVTVVAFCLINKRPMKRQHEPLEVRSRFFSGHLKPSVPPLNSFDVASSAAAARGYVRLFGGLLLTQFKQPQDRCKSLTRAMCASSLMRPRIFSRYRRPKPFSFIL